LRHCFGEAAFDGHKIQKNFVIGKPQLKGEIASGRQVYKQKRENTNKISLKKKDKYSFPSDLNKEETQHSLKLATKFNNQVL
jgi:hypothetical protein